jgi:ketosteroid isomerase-like protein
MRPSRFLSAAAATVFMAGCAPPPFDTATESAKLLKRDVEWAEAALAGTDVEKIVSYWTDDAVVIPQAAATVEGKAAIREYVTASLKVPGFKIHWVSEKPVFSPNGSMAYMRGTNEITVNDARGKPMTMKGRGVTIWRLDADGQWRCVIDIWNDPPATTVVGK